jgi:uncharacterized OsmC-like protein
MTSLLASAREARHIPADGGRLEAETEGFWEEKETCAKLVRIHVHYRIWVPPDMHDAALRAVEVHERVCPLSQSVRPAIAITYDAELLDDEER